MTRPVWNASQSESWQVLLAELLNQARKLGAFRLASTLHQQTCLPTSEAPLNLEIETAAVLEQELEEKSLRINTCIMKFVAGINLLTLKYNPPETQN